MTQPGQPQAQITANASIVQGPDGRHRVGLQVGFGPLTFGLMLDPDSAEQIMGSLGVLVADAVRQCKLANGGLIMPTFGPLPADLTMPPNGSR